MRGRAAAGKGGRIAGSLLLLAVIGAALRYDLALYHWQQGKERLAEGKARAALEAFGKCPGDFKRSPELKLDAGVAHYRLGAFLQAAELFREALAARDREVKGAALYNLGNCAYRLHLQKLGTDRETARRLLQEALQHYERSSALYPSDDARHNLEVSRARLAAWEREEKGAAGKEAAATGASAVASSGKEGGEKEGRGRSPEAREGERPRRGGRGKGTDGRALDNRAANSGAQPSPELGREEAERMLNEARRRESAPLLPAGGKGRGYSSRPSKDW